MKHLWLLALLLGLSVCQTQERVKSEETPLMPAAEVRQAEGGIWPIRAPLYTHDRRYHRLGYAASGELTSQFTADTLFPTDVIIVFTTAMTAPRIFLARSPHGGCLIRWDIEQERFHDPCYGSNFTLTGDYISGPSPRHLDRLPGAVRDGVIWVRGEIIYGQAHGEH